MKNIIAAMGVGIVAILAVSMFFVFNQGPDNRPVAEIYRSAGCGCCSGYEGYLASNDFNVKSIKTEDTSIKTSLGIPSSVWSCHTVKIGNYFVEGHVPIEAIKKLLDEQPGIDGIALSGMPHGSPGMGGLKSESFVVYAVTNGEISEFMVI